MTTIPLHHWQILTQLPNSTEISTVELHLGQYETCIFYIDRLSMVLDSYATKEQAIAGHIRFVNHELMHDLAKSG